MKKRILFVDDEPGILNGLQRSLRGQCKRISCLLVRPYQQADLFAGLLLMVLLCATAAPALAEDRLILAVLHVDKAERPVRSGLRGGPVLVVELKSIDLRRDLIVGRE